MVDWISNHVDNAPKNGIPRWHHYRRGRILHGHATLQSGRFLHGYTPYRALIQVLLDLDDQAMGAVPFDLEGIVDLRQAAEWEDCVDNRTVD